MTSEASRLCCSFSGEPTTEMIKPPRWTVAVGSIRTIRRTRSQPPCPTFRFAMFTPSTAAKGDDRSDGATMNAAGPWGSSRALSMWEPLIRSWARGIGPDTPIQYGSTRKEKEKARKWQLER